MAKKTKDGHAELDSRMTKKEPKPIPMKMGNTIGGRITKGDTKNAYPK